jgi:hypothetical protein
MAFRHISFRTLSITLAQSVAYALGGAGYQSSLSGVLATYAQGGRGAFRAANADGANATDNTGNGGEGGARSNGLALGGNGASGILVLRYPI